MTIARVQILHGEESIQYIILVVDFIIKFLPLSSVISIHRESALSILRTNDVFLKELKLLCTWQNLSSLDLIVMDVVAELKEEGVVSSSSSSSSFSSTSTSNFYVHHSAPLIAPIPRQILLKLLQHDP